MLLVEEVASLCFDRSTEEERTEPRGVVSMSVSGSAYHNVQAAVARRTDLLVSA